MRFTLFASPLLAVFRFTNNRIIFSPFLFSSFVKDVGRIGEIKKNINQVTASLFVTLRLTVFRLLRAHQPFEDGHSLALLLHQLFALHVDGGYEGGLCLHDLLLFLDALLVPAVFLFLPRHHVLQELFCLSLQLILSACELSDLIGEHGLAFNPRSFWVGFGFQLHSVGVQTCPWVEGFAMALACEGR